MKTKHSYSRETMNARINSIIAILCESKDKRVAHWAEDIKIINAGYYPPSWNNDDAPTVIAIGEWNSLQEYDEAAKRYVDFSDIPKRIEKLFAKLGVDVVWDETVSECDDCSRVFTTEPWCVWDRCDRGLSNMHEGKTLCRDCFCEEYPPMNE